MSTAQSIVYFSFYCRTTQTIEIAFGRNKIIAEDELLPKKPPTSWLKEQAQLATSQGKNNVYVTHGGHLRSNGESLVMQSSKED